VLGFNDFERYDFLEVVKNGMLGWVRPGLVGLVALIWVAGFPGTYDSFTRLQDGGWLGELKSVCCLMGGCAGPP